MLVRLPSELAAMSGSGRQVEAVEGFANNGRGDPDSARCLPLGTSHGNEVAPAAVLGDDKSQRHSGGSSHEPKNDPNACGEDSTELVAQRAQDSCSHGRAALLGTVVSVRLGAALLRRNAAVARLGLCRFRPRQIKAGGHLCPGRLFSFLRRPSNFGISSAVIS